MGRHSGVHAGVNGKTLLTLSGGSVKGSQNSYDRLSDEAVLKTIRRLGDRIEERFPHRNLGGVCRELERIAVRSSRDAARIGRPAWGLRLISAAGFVFTVAVLVLLPVALFGERIAAPIDAYATGAYEPFTVVQGLEATFNIVALTFFGLLFLTSIETRAKRHRAFKSLHRLRSITHVIDMHQLTKDPTPVTRSMPRTRSSPQRELTPGELARYLDYCTEMLSLTGKIAALYAQNSRDSQIIAAASDIEDLTTGLSRKIWQKLIILQHYAPEETKADAAVEQPLLRPDPV